MHRKMDYWSNLRYLPPSSRPTQVISHRVSSWTFFWNLFYYETDNIFDVEIVALVKTHAGCFAWGLVLALSIKVSSATSPLLLNGRSGS